MMKKRKLIWKIAGKVLLAFIFFLLIIILKSANWFSNNFNEVDFSVAMYQLFSPLKGTEAGVFQDYMDQCLYPSVFLALISVAAYTFYDMMAGRIFFGIRFSDWNCTWKTSGKQNLHFSIRLC